LQTIENFFVLFYNVFMKIQELLSPMRRAINQYSMIDDGDKIAVGVSGGKDSLVLLTLLHEFQRFSDKKFDLMGVTIDLGFAENAYAEIENYCKERGIAYVVEKTDIGEILFDVRKEKNPCSLCSKMRRGALNSVLTKNGFNKLALGHHLDDVVETFLLSLLHENRLSTFAPISYMSRSKVSLIRPMVFIPERDIASLAKTMPVAHNPCPANKHTEREAMKNILKDLRQNYPDVSAGIASAIIHSERYNLWDDVVGKYLKEKGDD